MRAGLFPVCLCKPRPGAAVPGLPKHPHGELCGGHVLATGSHDRSCMHPYMAAIRKLPPFLGVRPPFGLVLGRRLFPELLPRRVLQALACMFARAHDRVRGSCKRYDGVWSAPPLCKGKAACEDNLGAQGLLLVDVDVAGGWAAILASRVGIGPGPSVAQPRILRGKPL